MTVTLGIGKTPEWCNSFVLVPKANGKVGLCLILARLNKTLITPVNGSLTLYDILPRPAGLKYLTLVDASSGYHNLNLDEKSSYLTAFSCSFDRYRYIRLPIRAAPTRDMIQKIDEILSSISNIFGITDDILITGFDEWGKDFCFCCWILSCCT